MKKQFIHLSHWFIRTSKHLGLTRDEIVRSTPMGSKSASAVWNGHDVNLSYYLQVLKLLFLRADNPRYKLTRRQLIEGLIEALQEELKNL